MSVRRSMTWPVVVGASVALAAVVAWALWQARPSPVSVGGIAGHADGDPLGSTPGARPAAAPSPAVQPSPAAAPVPGASPSAPASARPPGPPPPTHLTESQLMSRLRKIKKDDPAAALALAREGNRRFSDSAEAPERSSIIVHALSALDRPSEARGEAEQMVNHYPDSDWVREVEMFVGAHRHRNLRLNDAGQVVTQ